MGSIGGCLDSTHLFPQWRLVGPVAFPLKASPGVTELNELELIDLLDLNNRVGMALHTYDVGLT